LAATLIAGIECVCLAVLYDEHSFFSAGKGAE
jgi:hypothetical protein